jgi:hypothetical protein
MKHTLAAVSGATLLIISAHRLPAPILEEKPSPTEAPSKPKSAPAKHKSSDSPNSSSIRRFDGTWRATFSSKNKFGSTFSNTKTLIIKDGTAVYILESTATLASRKRWSDLPAPYNSVSPIYKKCTDKATDVKVEGSNIRLRWPGWRLTDWTPKTIPFGVFKNVVGQPNSGLCILSGQQLIATSGKGGVTYNRVR